jgi:hypothetical protein
MMWNSAEHSNEENLRWCLLRASEWGRWPVFLSQTIAPFLLIWLSWQFVIAAVVVLNILWALFVRYKFVSISLASFGVMIVYTKWIVWPVSTVIIFIQKTYPEFWISLAWPALIFVIGAFPTIRVERIQTKFMQDLGYQAN